MQIWLIVVIAIVGSAAVATIGWAVYRFSARSQHHHGELGAIDGGGTSAGGGLGAVDRGGTSAGEVVNREVNFAVLSATTRVTKGTHTVAQTDYSAPVTESSYSVAPAQTEDTTPVTESTYSIAPAGREAPPATTHSPEVAKEVAIPKDKGVYKEAPMVDNFVARDEDEAKLIQTWRPNCSVFVPPNYEQAIEIITECPLSCPYRAVRVSLTELDQETLRKPPTK